MGFTRFWTWAYLFWWRVTQFFTGLRRKSPVQIAHSVSEIPRRLDWGRDYVADKANGDFLTHPRKVQARINGEKDVGDCEDHAGYWASVLLKSRLSEEVCIGVVQMEFPNGRRSGHAVVLFERDGHVYYGDYGDPVLVSPPTVDETIETNGWWWATVVAERYNAKLRAAAELPVELGERDGLRFKRAWRITGRPK